MIFSVHLKYESRRKWAFFFGPRYISNTGGNSTPSSGEPYSLGAGNEKLVPGPSRHQGIVGVKDVKGEIEVIREFSRGH